MIDKKYVTSVVSKALDTQFEIYSFVDLVYGDTDLSYDEKDWAIKNLTYGVKEIKP